MTSNDLTMISNENDKLVSNKVKPKKNLKGGHRKEDYSIQGRDLFEQSFFPKKLLRFKKIRIEDSNVQNEISQTIEKKKQ